MNYLFSAALPTLVLMGYQIGYLRNRRNPLMYIAVFLGIALSNYLYDNYLEARAAVYSCCLTPEQRDYYFDLIHRHYYAGYANMQAADHWSNYLLDDAEQKLTKAVICGVVAGILARDIKSAGITTAAALLQDSLEKFKELWPKIQSSFHQAAYHIEMAEFYQDVLAADG